MKTGKIYGIGLGPGNPDLITMKSYNIILNSKYVFFFKKKGNESRALGIVKDLIPHSSKKIPLEYPVTTEIDSSNITYKTKMKNFYQECVNEMNKILKKPSDICILCEGDPFFYGSFIHIFQIQKQYYEIEVVPGVTGMSGAWSASKIPMVTGKETMSIIMGTLSKEKLKIHLKKSDSLVIMKIGHNYEKIYEALKENNLINKAYLISDATTCNQKIYKINEIDNKKIPYFSIILINKSIKT